MPLTVEDGTGMAAAQSYISVADADTHFSARGITLWDTMLDVEKEQALTRATDYLVQVYRTRWMGDRVTATQALDWPREGVEVGGFDIDEDVVPAEVKRACAEMAFKAASGELAADIERLTKREKVGPIEVEYSDNVLPYRVYRAIDNLLAPFLVNAGSRVFRQVIRT